MVAKLKFTNFSDKITKILEHSLNMFTLQATRVSRNLTTQTELVCTLYNKNRKLKILTF